MIGHDTTSQINVPIDNHHLFILQVLPVKISELSHVIQGDEFQAGQRHEVILIMLDFYTVCTAVNNLVIHLYLEIQFGKRKIFQ